jgi:NodT family efflux transporter outer membrane factor (OMF) lipoprotein
MVNFHTIAKGGLITALVSLAGCADLSSIRPESKVVDVNGLEPGVAVSTSNKISWPEKAWWDKYNDPQLDALVKRAIANNPLIRNAKARIRLAESQVGYQNSSILPKSDIEAATSRERFTGIQFIPPPWGGHTYWNNSATVSLSYDLDLWGRQESKWKAALDEAKAVSVEEQEVRIELEDAVVRSYIRLANSYAMHEIAEKRKIELAQRVEIEKQRLLGGMGTQWAVSEAEAKLPMAEARIEAIDVQIAYLKNELAALMGQGPGSGEAIKVPQMALRGSIGLPDKLPANLIGRRPDVVASRLRVEAANNQISSAKAEYFPNINLAAFTGFEAIGFGQFLSHTAFTAGAGPALSLPLFDGGKRRAGLSAATSLYDMAVEQYNGIVIGALKSVSDQLEALRHDEIREAEASKTLDIVNNVNDLAVKSFDAGLSDYLRVLDAQETVLNEEEELAEIQSEKFEAYAGLILRLGGGLK